MSLHVLNSLLLHYRPSSVLKCCFRKWFSFSTCRPSIVKICDFFHSYCQKSRSEGSSRFLWPNLKSLQKLYRMTSMARKKANVRTYDQDGYRRRAACVCVRDNSEREVLLVSTSRNPELWIIPGGGIEPTEEVQMAALREVLEEAGVRGQLDRCLGVFESSSSKTRTIVFVMIVAEQLDEWDEARSMGRRRKWFSMDDARHHLQLHRPAHLLYLDNLAANGSSGSSCCSDNSNNISCNNSDNNNHQQDHPS